MKIKEIAAKAKKLVQQAIELSYPRDYEEYMLYYPGPYMVYDHRFLPH